MAPHNIWIECAHRARVGEELTVRIKFGHDFVLQGKADPLRTKAWLISPVGSRTPLALETGETDLAVAFTPAEPGVYTLLVEYDGKIWSIAHSGRHLRGPRSDHPGIMVEKSVYYYQFAKAFVSVESDVSWPGPMGSELELAPQSPAGGRLMLAVLYKGQPLEGARVQAFRSGDGFSDTATTDAEGVVYFPFKGGSWMILASHTDPQKDVAGQYDERGLVAVFTITH